MNKETATELKIHHKPVIRWTLLTAGTIFVGIGTLGIFLPLLPTTVFFLLAGWCYARSSHRLYDWLHHNKYFGKYLKNYREGKGVSVRSKALTIIVLWGGIGYSATMTDSLPVQLILLAVAVGVTIHIIVIPTYKPNES